jgi:hypothetical protein
MDLGVPVPEESVSLIATTATMCFNANSMEWKLDSAFATKSVNPRFAAPVLVHTIACVAWSCNSTVAISLVGSKTNDEMTDASRVVHDNKVYTDVFWPSNETRGSKVFLHREFYKSKLLRDVPGLTLNDLTKIKTNGERGTVYLIPTSSKLGAVVQVTHNKLSEEMQCDPPTIKDGQIVLRKLAVNQCIDDTGQDFIQKVKDEITGIKPIDIGGFIICAEPKGEKTKDWFLWMRVVIVCRPAV